METENKYVGILHHIVKCGLIKCNESNSIYPLELSHNNTIPLTRVNEFFFGTNSFVNKLNYMNLFRENMIKKHLGIYWVYISKLENYLKKVLEIINLETSFNFCPYNYYKTFKHSEIPSQYKQMINSIDNFVKYLETIDTTEARTIKFIMMPNTKIGQYSKLETEVVDSLDLGESKSLILKFTKKGSPLFIQLTYSSEPIKNVNQKTNNFGSLRICDYHNENENKELYDYICNRMLMDTPEQFLINNIERVCGSREFAETMVKSYLNKNQYIYSINEISGIILWKKESNRKDYIQYFIQHYPNCINIDDSDDSDDSNILLNFEGINKFFLNINIDDVENFEVKEQINEMYYNSMSELIHSFELLYKNKP